jgi:peptide/nickel transport system permease protein
MPATILGFGSLAVVVRITRCSILDVIEKDYILTARAKGLRQPKIAFDHILRNALSPIITMIGLEIGYLLGGSIIVESVFAWPGIGRYAAKAILSADYNSIMGITFLGGVIFFLTSSLVDFIVLLVDPRVEGQFS